MTIRTLLVPLLALLLGACGFHLRGQEGMPFHTLYLDASNPNTLFIGDLRRSLEDNRITLVNSAEQADVVLNIASETPDKQILTLGATGRVTEFRLVYRISLRAYDLRKHDWLPAEEITTQRDLSYDDTEILAKESEEQLLYQGMRSDMVEQIVRRLSHAKPLPQ